VGWGVGVQWVGGLLVGLLFNCGVYIRIMDAMILIVKAIVSKSYNFMLEKKGVATYSTTFQFGG
jgi:hypothetical protein